MKPLTEIKKTKPKVNNAKLLDHFDKCAGVVKLHNPEGIRMAEWKRLVLIHHPFDENQWFVSAAFASPLQLAAILSCGQNCIQRKKRLYVPLLELEDVTGERLDNIRDIVKDSVQQIARSL